MIRALIIAAAALTLTGLARADGLQAYTGRPLPDFRLPDLDGHEHRLGDYRGRVVVVHFWATYCGPCIKEMPELQRLREHFKGAPFAVLAVNMGEDRATVDGFLKKMKVDLTFLLDEQGTVLQSWNVYVAPSSFVIDPDGKIRYALFGPLEWNRPDSLERIKALLPR